MSHVLSAASPRSSVEDDPRVALRHILWACDFSECSAGALRLAIPLARAFGSDITALHVMPTTFPLAREPCPHEPESAPAPYSSRRPDALTRSVGPAVAASVSTHTALREGKPVDEILARPASLPRPTRSSSDPMASA